MIKEYLPDQEKRILLSALSHEMKLVKDNNLTELIPIVKNLDFKFMYDRLFKQIENNAYQQGIADAIEKIIFNAYESESGFLTIRKGFLEQLKEQKNDNSRR